MLAANAGRYADATVLATSLEREALAGHGPEHPSKLQLRSLRDVVLASSMTTDAIPAAFSASAAGDPGARRHIRVPGEEQIPALIATAVIQLGVTDLEALGALFASPEVEEVFGTWRARYPSKAAWANHETLA